MSTLKKKSSLLHDNDASEFDADNNPASRLGGDIIITGVSCRVMVAGLHQDEDDLPFDSDMDHGFTTLDPVSQLLWSQSLRSLH